MSCRFARYHRNEAILLYRARRRLKSLAYVLVPMIVIPLEEGSGVRATPASPRALARRRLVHPRRRDVLLPLQSARRLQPVPRPLGDPRDDDRGRGGDDHPAGAGTV